MILFMISSLILLEKYF
ncbi:hypothetical protein H2280_07165 [Campylobacter sp. 2457A]|nr:hypothetical protein [Campylobacter sp. 2457A]